MTIQIEIERITAEELIQRQKQQFKEEHEFLRLENIQQKAQIDKLINMLALCKEEIQQLKDEIAVLKGQKPRPKIPASKLEGSRNAKGSDGNKGDQLGRGKHPRKKKISTKNS